MKIAILTPSRSRPEGLYKLYESVKKTASGKHQIELIVGIDRDDPKRSEYIAFLKKMQKGKITVRMIEDERKPLAKIWNSLIKYSFADWYTCGNDDEVYITQDWDEIFYQRTKGNHPFYLYWFDDGLQGGNHCAFPILSKEWIKTVGYFFPEIFIHNYVDTWVFDIACKVGTTVYIPEVKHQHLHYSIGLNEYDQTYKDGMAGDSNEKDKRLFLQTEAQRNKTVQLIKTKICQQDFSL